MQEQERPPAPASFGDGELDVSQLNLARNHRLTLPSFDSSRSVAVEMAVESGGPTTSGASVWPPLSNTDWADRGSVSVVKVVDSWRSPVPAHPCARRRGRGVRQFGTAASRPLWGLPDRATGADGGVGVDQRRPRRGCRPGGVLGLDGRVGVDQRPRGRRPARAVPLPGPFTGASVSINGDPDEAVAPVGFWAWTGALVLTSVPVAVDPPELVPLPGPFTGALVLINGDPDEAVPLVPVDPVPADPLPVPADGTGVLDAGAEPVALVPGVEVLLFVPMFDCATGDAATVFGHEPAKAGVVEDIKAAPAPAIPRRDALKAMARGVFGEGMHVKYSFGWFSRWLSGWSRRSGRVVHNRNA